MENLAILVVATVGMTAVVKILKK